MSRRARRWHRKPLPIEPAPLPRVSTSLLTQAYARTVLRLATMKARELPPADVERGLHAVHWFDVEARCAEKLYALCTARAGR